MKIFFRLLVFFMAMPVVELALLTKMSDWIGYWWTIAIIAVTAVAGSYLAKHEGLSAWSRLQNRLGEGGLPGQELLDGVIILIAGALLITPGVLTDLTGFIGLIPLTRRWIRKLAMKRLKKAVREGRIESTFGAFGGAWTSPGASGDMPYGDGTYGDGTYGDGTYGEETGNETAPPEVGGAPSPRGPAPEQNNSTHEKGMHEQEPHREPSDDPPALDTGDESEKQT